MIKHRKNMTFAFCPSCLVKDARVVYVDIIHGRCLDSPSWHHFVCVLYVLQMLNQRDSFPANLWLTDFFPCICLTVPSYLGGTGNWNTTLFTSLWRIVNSFFHCVWFLKRKEMSRSYLYFNCIRNSNRDVDRLIWWWFSEVSHPTDTTWGRGTRDKRRWRCHPHSHCNMTSDPTKPISREYFNVLGRW